MLTYSLIHHGAKRKAPISPEYAVQLLVEVVKHDGTVERKWGTGAFLRVRDPEPSIFQPPRKEPVSDAEREEEQRKNEEEKRKNSAETMAKYAAAVQQHELSYGREQEVRHETAIGARAATWKKYENGRNVIKVADKADCNGYLVTNEHVITCGVQTDQIARTAVLVYFRGTDRFHIIELDGLNRILYSERVHVADGDAQRPDIAVLPVHLPDDDVFVCNVNDCQRTVPEPNQSVLVAGFPVIRADEAGVFEYASPVCTKGRVAVCYKNQFRIQNNMTWGASGSVVISH